MVSYNGKVTYGAGYPAHKAGGIAEPLKPCVTRQMTPEERKFYGVDPEKGEPKKMGNKRGKRINIGKLEELVKQGFSVSDIAKELNTTKDIIWARAKAHKLVTKLRVNSEDAPELVVAEDPPVEKKLEPKQMEYPQDSEENEYRFIAPVWLNEIAIGLTAGAVKHPGETWRGIPCAEHLARAMRHINLYRMGDRSEPHLINASMRLMMAFETEGE